MKLIICVSVLLALAFVASAEQQRILRRVIKSTPTATNLARIRTVTIRSPGSGAESGVVTEISSKEAANFGQRSNETTPAAPVQQVSGGTKNKAIPAPVASPQTSTTTTSTTSTAAPTTSSEAATTSTTTGKPETVKPKASDRQQAAPQGAEVELLSGAPSSWQTMTAVEAPAAMLIATGTRAAASSSNDLSSSSSSTVYSSEESASQTGDFLRASSTKGASRSQVGETFSRLRQQAASKQQQQQQQQQQSYFYPQETRASGKTNAQPSKTNWYQPTTSAPRPAPIVQEQQYEQQAEQYVEQQQQQVEYPSAPLGQAEPFAFDFNTKDNSGNGQYRKEESDKNGVVRGSYGYTDANGIYRHVEYVADQNGFRANIKSNEPGLIGETQPASIQLAGGAAPQQTSRLSAPRASNDNGDWVSSEASNSQGPSADLALAPPEFESSHKPERARNPRHYRN